MVNEIMVNDSVYKIYGENVEIKNNKIKVDGETIVNEITQNSKIVINGDVTYLNTSQDVSVNGNVKGYVECDGNCHVEGDVYGDIDCKESCTCMEANGNIDAGGMINIINSMKKEKEYI